MGKKQCFCGILLEVHHLWLNHQQCSGLSDERISQGRVFNVEEMKADKDTPGGEVASSRDEFEKRQKRSVSARQTLEFPQESWEREKGDKKKCVCL